VKPARIVALALVLVSFAITALAYPHLPAQIATHWGPSGAPDGFAPKSAAWWMPVIAATLGVILLWLPRIFPLRANFESFRPMYDWFVAAFEAFFLGLNAWTLAFNLGYEVSANVFMPFAMGLLFILVGAMLPRAKRNWVFGIRTAWTLTDDRVWAETHRVGGWLFVGAGVVSLVGALFPKYGIWFVIVPALVAGMGSVAYSYAVWVRLGRPQGGGAAPAA
jgi:uncharacterized membrane protein